MLCCLYSKLHAVFSTKRMTREMYFTNKHALRANSLMVRKCTQLIMSNLHTYHSLLWIMLKQNLYKKRIKMATRLLHIIWQ